MNHGSPLSTTVKDHSITTWCRWGQFTIPIAPSLAHGQAPTCGSSQSWTVLRASTLRRCHTFTQIWFSTVFMHWFLCVSHIPRSNHAFIQVVPLKIEHSLIIKLWFLCPDCHLVFGSMLPRVGKQQSWWLQGGQWWDSTCQIQCLQHPKHKPLGLLQDLCDSVQSNLGSPKMVLYVSPRERTYVSPGRG